MKKKLIPLIIIISITFSLSGCHFNHPEAHKATNSRKLTHKNNPELSREAGILLDEGLNNLNNNNIPDAIDDFSDLAKLHPDLVESHYNLGLAYAKNNQMIDAIKAWETALKLDSTNPDIYYNLGQACKIAKNNQKASVYLTKYLLLRPNDSQKKLIMEEISKLKEPALGKGIIGRIFISDTYDPKIKTAVGNKGIFVPDTNIIYTSFELIQAPKDTDINVKWHYKAFENQRVPINSYDIKVNGTKNVVLSLSKPKTAWPAGEYEIEIFVNNKLNSLVPFVIR